MEEKQYKTDLNFRVNSAQFTVKVAGEGVPLLIELADASHRFINFGTPLVGKTVTKPLHIINKSRASFNMFVDLYQRLPFYVAPPKMLVPEFEQEVPDAVIKVEPAPVV